MRIVGLQSSLRHGLFRCPTDRSRLLKVSGHLWAHFSLDHFFKAFFDLFVRLFGVELEPMGKWGSWKFPTSLSSPPYYQFVEERERLPQVLYIFHTLGLGCFGQFVHYLIDVLLHYLNSGEKDAVAAGGNLGEVASAL